MIPSCVQTAKSKLSTSDAPTLSRDLVVAYATLSAFDHHYSDQSDDEVRKLLLHFQWIRETEPSRFIKQRRIGLCQIVSEMGSVLLR